MLNYIEFENAIRFFRKKDQVLNKDNSPKSIGSKFYLLTDFKIFREYNVGECIITRSEQIFIDNNTYTNVSEIKIPEWVYRSKNVELTSESFSLVLSALISFGSERDVRLYRNYYNINSIERISAELPLQHSGPGAIHKLNEKSVESILQNVSQLFDIIDKLDYADYETVIRSSRLFQLAQNTKRLDHNLSYSLIVSSIETNADKAIRVKDVKKGWSEIKKRIKQVADDAELEQEFRDVLFDKLNHHYSGIRFRKFIKENALFNSIKLDNRYHRMGLLQEEKEAFEPIDKRLDPLNYFIHENRSKPDFLLHLEEHTGINYDNLLKDSYSYRSKFYHAGEAMKHNTPNNFDRYIKMVYTEQGPIKILSINFLASLARITATTYYHKKIGNIS
ncbi:hypothetical protein [Pseudofulvibacter geojedonensis]|uniref:ApeA N-terminal domain-containing protein n=1 Tax=Pseudofulvibacter geojedonensis TaxID=1123758 RepID=A0ABW3I3F6_9FLAO